MYAGASPSGKAAVFGTAIRRFDPFRPSHSFFFSSSCFLTVIARFSKRVGTFPPSIVSLVVKPSSSNHHHSSFEQAFFHTPDTYVHETALIGPNVILHDGVKVGPNSVILGNTIIGKNSQIHANVMIGSTAQDTSVRAPLGTVVIGEQVVCKEFVTVSSPKSDDGVTTIGDRSYLMHFAHVGHDATLEHDVVLTNNAQIGGHAHIEHHCYIMANAGVHQRCRVGNYTALAPHSGARQDLPPYSLFVGRPGKFAGLNTFLLRREGFDIQTIHALKSVTTWFYRDNIPTADLMQKCMEHEWHTMSAVTQLITFITNSARGVSRQRITTESSMKGST